MRVPVRRRQRPNEDVPKEWKFHRGDVIIQAQPFAAALQPQLAGKFCDECMKPYVSTKDASSCEQMTTNNNKLNRMIDTAQSLCNECTPRNMVLACQRVDLSRD